LDPKNAGECVRSVLRYRPKGTTEEQMAAYYQILVEVGPFFVSEKDDSLDDFKELLFTGGSTFAGEAKSSLKIFRVWASNLYKKLTGVTAPASLVTSWPDVQ